MKALTLTQPWASLIATGEKRVETRGWATNHRGPLLIHAAKGLGPVGGKRGLEELCASEPFFSALAMEPADQLPRGAIVAVVNVLDCVPADPASSPELAERFRVAPDEEAFGFYAPDRWAWLLELKWTVPEPIAAKGALGIWTVPSSTERLKSIIERTGS